MKMFITLSVGILVLVVGIAACTTSRAGYETAPYKVVRADGAFEIREYPEIRIATTRSDASGSGFMRLFRYIDGGNVEKEKIAMTTPVFMVDGKMAFVVPEKHKANAPAPASDQVSVDTMKAQRVAAYRYSGSRSAKSEPQALEKLKAWMQQNRLQASGQPFSAYYDPPWTPGFLRRNEVLVPIQTH